MLGQNIKQARLAQRLSLRDLAARVTDAGRVTLNYSALQRIESGQRKVASHELVELAEALDTTTTRLLGRGQRSAALALAARLSEDVPSSTFEAGGQRAIQLLEAADVLQRVVGMTPTRPAPAFEPVAATRSGGQRLATIVRDELGLGTGPVAHLGELVQSRFGAYVAHEPLPQGTLGFCVAGEGEAVILINSNDIHGRQRFTLAHGLCHLICGDLDTFEVIAENGATSGAEGRADAFAAHFLVPDDGLRQATGGAAVDAEEAARLALNFEVSLRMMLNRLEDLRLIRRSEADRARAEGPRHLSYSAAVRAEFDDMASRQGRISPPRRLADAAVAAYLAGQIGLGLLGDVFGKSNLSHIKAELEARGFLPPRRDRDRSHLA